MWVFSEIMGLPVDDRRLLIELGDKLLGNTDPEVVGEENVRDLAATDPSIRLLPFSSPFAADLIDYGCRLGAARRTDPRDDVTTGSSRPEIDGSRLSEHEFGLFFILLTTAGNETTRHTISLGLIDLLANPDERAQARRRSDPRGHRCRRDSPPRTPRPSLPPHRRPRRRGPRSPDQGRR